MDCIHVFNQSGCHGHYLRYLIERFRPDTPKIKKLPFNKQGNSHIDIGYSGLVEYTDSYLEQNLSNFKNKKIVALDFKQDLLYFERISTSREDDQDRDLHNLQNHIVSLQNYIPDLKEKLKVLYGCESHNTPKSIIRDFYKLGFLDINNLGAYKLAKKMDFYFNSIKNQNNIYIFNILNFFSYDMMKNALQNLSDHFNLKLDLRDLDIIHSEFMKRNHILTTHQNTTNVLNAVKQNQNIKIPDLDIIQQAWVYAELEKNYNYIIMPTTDYFFTNTLEIINYIKFYPNHYKAMNPNLPKFNNIPNPYFLHRQKTK